MLFDFYKKQNAKRSGSVNASYWVTGKKRPQPSSQHTKGTISQDDEDSFMPSSPFPSSIPDRGEEKVEDTGPSESHMIVREEELKGTSTESSLWQYHTL
jgi:DNA polymerase delta subunit 3